MNRDLAKLVALTAFRSSAELGQLLPILKEHCTPTEYKEFADAIAGAMTAIDRLVTETAKAFVPGLDNEWAAKVAAYGRVF